MAAKKKVAKKAPKKAAKKKAAKKAKKQFKVLALGRQDQVFDSLEEANEVAASIPGSRVEE